MAGRVGCRLVIGRDAQSWEIQPEVCPGMDFHRAHAMKDDPGLAPKCQTYDFGNGRRSCPYWYATTREGNAAQRIDGSVLWEETTALNRTLVRCGVLCHVARRNRPPGT